MGQIEREPGDEPAVTLLHGNQGTQHSESARYNGPSLQNELGHDKTCLKIEIVYKFPGNNC